MLLKLAWTATLFTIGLVHTGSWEKAVLDRWSVNCTLFSHPPPYPHELRRLANGSATWHGIKQLFTCAPDPEWEAFFKELRAREAASERSKKNQSTVGKGPVPELTRRRPVNERPSCFGSCESLPAVPPGSVTRELRAR